MCHFKQSLTYTVSTPFLIRQESVHVFDKFIHGRLNHPKDCLGEQNLSNLVVFLRWWAGGGGEWREGVGESMLHNCDLHSVGLV